LEKGVKQFPNSPPPPKKELDIQYIMLLYPLFTKLSIVQVIRERGGPAFSEEEERGEGEGGGNQPSPDDGQMAAIAATAADGPPEPGAEEEEVGREREKEAPLDPDHP
jgi:hypothetical protein